MAYGKIKADAIIYDNSGSDVEKTIASLASAAPTANPTFTGDVTLTGSSANVVFDASDNALEFADGAKAFFGTGSDFKIYHDGNNSYLEDSGTGNLNINTSKLQVVNPAGSETYAKFNQDNSVELYYNNSKKIETTTAGVTVTGSVTDDKGDVRNIPLSQKTSAYVLVAADAGKAIHITTGGVTVNNSVFSAGNAVTIINDSGSDQTITQGSGLTIHNSADAATGNRTLAGRGIATIWFAAADKAYISGAGLS